MTRRRSAVPPDSLDLLLDTICNAFGGIVLLALLIVLITGRAKPKDASQTADVSVLDHLELMHQLEQLETTRQVLEGSIAMSSQLLDSLYDSTAQKSIDSIERLAAAEKTVAETYQQRNAQLRDLQQALASIDAEIQRTNTELADAKNATEALNDQLEAEKQRRTTVMDLPNETPTSKRMVVFLVRYDRLYVVDSSRGSGEFKPNDAHLDPASSNADIVFLGNKGSYKTDSNGGIPMDTPDALTDEFKQYDNGRVFATIVVWPDSFNNFSTVRDSLVASSLEYQVYPIEKGPIQESPSASRPMAQ